MKKDEIRIPAMAISMLVNIKQEIMKDNDLSMNVTNCGKYAAAHYIDELIRNVLAMESRYNEIMEENRHIKRENKEYTELFGGYSPDMLEEEEKAKVRALVKEWEARDEAEEGGLPEVKRDGADLADGKKKEECR